MVSARCRAIGCSVADPFNGKIDEFRIAHLQRSDGWIATTVNGDTDYIASGTVRDLDLYEVGDLPFHARHHPSGPGD